MNLSPQTWMIALAVIVALGGLFLMQTAGTIPSEEARRLVAGGALLVDVRTPTEFAEGHIQGAKNIPLQELAQRTDEFGEKGREIVLYCRSGARSSQAKTQLEQGGYHAVHNLGGMYRW
jgi:rhodanese-related sulfurtransferase